MSTDTKPTPTLPDLPAGQFFRVYKLADRWATSHPYIQLRRKTWYGSTVISDDYEIERSAESVDREWVPTASEIARAARRLLTRRAAWFKTQAAEQVAYGNYPPKKLGGNK
jgi:hypothetical protein